MNIGETIRTIRTERGLSQDEFAGMFNVTRQCVSNWENNKNYPDLDTLMQISKSFNISLDVMLNNDPGYVRRNDATIRVARKNKKVIIILAVLVIAMMASIIFLISNQQREAETGSLKFKATEHMSIGVGDAHNYCEDQIEIARIAKTLSGDYITQKQIIMDPEEGMYQIQMWDDPDGNWEMIIVMDQRHIVYNGWKCRKVDAPIDLNLIEKEFNTIDG